MGKRILKIAGFTIAGIIIFLALLFVLISSGILNSFIASKISKTASKQTNAEIHIEKIEGNILRNFMVNGISVTQKNQEIISIDSLQTDYNIWKIINKKIEVDFIRIYGIQSNLKQEKDSLWNFEKLIVEDNTVKTDTISSPFLWEINLNNISIYNFSANINPLDTALQIPKSIKLETELNFKYSNNFSEVELQKFELIAKNPSLQISNFKFKAQISDSIVSWENLHIQLAKTIINAEGKIPLYKWYNAELEFKASPLNFDDFKDWLPPIYGNPEINIQLKNENSKNKLNFQLVQENQILNIQGFISEINKIPKYSFILETDSLNGEFWTKNPDFKSNIKGKFEIEGEGFDFKESQLKAQAQFADIKYNNYNLNHLILQFDKTEKKLDGNIIAKTVFGELDSKIQIEDLFNISEYNALFKLKKFDLAKLTANKNLESLINLEIQANGKGFEPGKMETNIKIKSINSKLFKQSIQNINTKIAVKNYNYLLEDFFIETPYLQAKITGKGNIKENNLLNFRLKAKNVEQLIELLDLPLSSIDGEISGKIAGRANNMKLTSQLQINHFTADSLELKNATAEINSNFSIHPGFNQKEAIKSGNEAQFIDYKKIDFTSNAKIDYAAFGNYFLENIELNVEKNKETASGELVSLASFGKIETNFTVQKLFGEPEYNLTGLLQNIDISAFTNSDTLLSNLNIGIGINGKGIQPETLQSEVKIHSENSFIYGMPLEDFNAQLTVKNQNYSLNGFNIQTPFIFANARGNGNWKTSNQIQFDIKTKNIQKLNAVFGAGKLNFNGQINGTISGSADSLYFSSLANISNLTFDTLSIKESSAEINFQKINNVFSGHLNLLLNNVGIQDFNAKKIELASTFNAQNANNNFTYFANDSLNGNIISVVEFSEKPTFHFPSINLNFYGNKWKNANNDAFIRFGKDSIEINRFEMLTNESSFNANGIFAFNGTENLNVEINNLNLLKIPGIQLLPYQFSGKINSELKLTGTSENPIFTGKILFNNLEIDSLKFKAFTTEIDYQNKNLKVITSLDDYTSRLISGEVNLPFHFSFTNNIYFPQVDDSVSGRIEIENLDIERFNRYIPLNDMEAKGFLNAKINIDNTASNPNFNGWFNYTNGAFSYKKAGIYYNNIQMNSRINKNVVFLDSLQVLAGKGKFKMLGDLEFESLKTGNVKNINLNINGKNFKAFDSEMIRAVVNTNLTIKGTKENPVFGGNMLISRSALNTDIFLKEYNRVYNDSDLPMLVVAQKNAEVIQVRQIEIKDTTQKPAPDIYKNLTGEFDVEIPRNTWIKGKNMNFELSGSMKAIKASEKIDFFGTLNVKRGFYKIYGRRLDFEDGELTFTGGQSLNPITNFNIAYKFRDPENTLRKLNVKITGRISKPEISFLLDDEPIEEKEAISYLLFNKNINQLDTKEDASINNNLDVAKALAINQFSNVMKDVLQSSFGLDVIEISGKGGWTQGSVSIGKYITNNLFLNYERTFALDKKDKVIEPEKITLEYQFYRTLFLQATNQSSNSGFDFIIKWTWK